MYIGKYRDYVRTSWEKRNIYIYIYMKKFYDIYIYIYIYMKLYKMSKKFKGNLWECVNFVFAVAGIPRILDLGTWSQNARPTPAQPPPNPHFQAKLFGSRVWKFVGRCPGCLFGPLVAGSGGSAWAEDVCQSWFHLCVLVRAVRFWSCSSMLARFCSLMEVKVERSWMSSSRLKI